MTDHRCPRCRANLTADYCEYCGWNSHKIIKDKTLTLSGLLCELIVTKENCTFKPQVGSPSVIINKEIAQISLSQAPLVGTGEFSLLTITGITQKITFLYPQNPNITAIASYLSQVAPEAKFANVLHNDASVTNIDGIMCPKCKSNNTKMTGQSRDFSVWKILFGIFLVLTGFTGITQGQTIGIFIIIIIGGIALSANGLRLIGKKKLDYLCGNCGNRFRV